MKRRLRDSKGRFVKQYREASLADKFVVFSAIFFAIGLVLYTEYVELTTPVVASEVIEIDTQEEERKEVRIQVIYDEESIIEEIERVFGKDHIMLKVAWCESRYDQFAFNPTNNSNDRGVLQISELWHGVGDEMYDVKKNIAYAKKLYDRNGLRDWNASRSCWSK